MIMADVSKLVPFILKWEGGFQQMKEDTGNYLNGVLIGTNKGITPAAYQMTFGKVPTVQDMKNITHEQFMAVLKRFYWDRWKADSIQNQSVANILVDWVWASGKHGIEIPQKVLGLKPDGVVGVLTLKAINCFDQHELFDLIKKERIDFIDRIIKNRPTNAKFRRGWLNRINAFTFTV